MHKRRTLIGFTTVCLLLPVIYLGGAVVLTFSHGAHWISNETAVSIVDKYYARLDQYTNSNLPGAQAVSKVFGTVYGFGSCFRVN